MSGRSQADGRQGLRPQRGAGLQVEVLDALGRRGEKDVGPALEGVKRRERRGEAAAAVSVEAFDAEAAPGVALAQPDRSRGVVDLEVEGIGRMVRLARVGRLQRALQAVG